jgi:hypothetical protein
MKSAVEDGRVDTLLTRKGTECYGGPYGKGLSFRFRYQTACPWSCSPR